MEEVSVQILARTPKIIADVILPTICLTTGLNEIRAQDRHTGITC
jgi:hypothetical protein